MTTAKGPSTSDIKKGLLGFDKEAAKKVVDAGLASQFQSGMEQLAQKTTQALKQNGPAAQPIGNRPTNRPK